MAQRIYAQLAGIGSYLPGAPISNDALIQAKGLDSSDEWIVTRTGITARHHAAEGVTSSMLAEEASLRALADAGIDAADLDLIIVATSTPDIIFPSTACLLQGKLGNVGATAFDVQAVCSGFVYAMTIAEKFIQSGSHKTALIVGAEVFSRIMDWQDRGTCVLFGDGAGAVVLKAAEQPGLLATSLHADGSQADILNVPGQVRNGVVTGDPFLRMDGQAVFKFAVRALTDSALECCDAAGITPEQIDWLIPHQANVRIIEAIGKRLSLPAEKVIVTVAHHGNTSAASVPLALDEAVKAGRVKRGQTLMLQGVGGGFTWGSVLLKY
ncbi:MAG: beta-ketoacyl-ACP synthase III [Fluviibacter sp.]